MKRGRQKKTTTRPKNRKFCLSPKKKFSSAAKLLLHPPFSRSPPPFFNKFLFLHPLLVTSKSCCWFFSLPLPLPPPPCPSLYPNLIPAPSIPSPLSSGQFSLQEKGRCSVEPPSFLLPPPSLKWTNKKYRTLHTLKNLSNKSPFFFQQQLLAAEEKERKFQPIS